MQDWLRIRHFPDPKDMEDEHLIGMYESLTEELDAGRHDDRKSFVQYYLDCLLAEIERRGYDEPIEYLLP